MTDTIPLLADETSDIPGPSIRQLPRYHVYEALRAPALAFSYCASSISAVYLNKLILAPRGAFPGFGSVGLLMAAQSIIGTLILLALRLCGVITFSIATDMSRLKRIALVNLLFVAMTSANAYSVKLLAIPMVSLLKNCQVVLVCFLEFLILKAKPSALSMVSLLIIVIASVCGSLTDLEFNLRGYLWMCTAILSSSLYYISIKYAFKQKQVQEFTLIFYNNLFSIPYFFLSSLFDGNFGRDIRYFVNPPPLFVLLVIISGFTGIGVNVFTYLFLSISSPTSFSVLGVVKKILQTIIGYLAFKTDVNVGNVMSVSLGIVGGVMYTISKKIKKT